jgi:anti-sigma-K factor RskA
MRSDKEIRELINLYIFGALDTDEKADAKDYLKQAEYLKYYNETRFLVDHTAYSYEDDTPVPDILKSEIISKLDDIADKSQAESGKARNDNVIRPSFFNRYGYAIAASIVGFLLIYTFTLSQQLKEQQLQIVRLQTESSESHHFVDFVNNPDVFQVKMAADDNSQAIGNLAWNKSSNDAMLYVSNLKELQENNVYQLWVVHKDNSVVEAMGTFNVNPDGTFMLTIGCMPKPSDTKAIFVTMEPDGGMPHPTGNKYLSGYL